jgi:hypothetical protein
MTNDDSKKQPPNALDVSANRERPDVSWDAFCYVAGEMSADDRRNFEIRLQDDQIAREAVANEVSSCQLIDAAIATDQDSVFPTEIRSRADTNSMETTRTIKPLILATLACVLLSIVGFYGINSWGDRAPVAQNTIHSAENLGPDSQQIILAEAWADTDWEATLVALNASNDSENEFDLGAASLEFDSDWIEATMSDMEADSSVNN